MADGAGACDVYPEDEGGDFGGGREGDVRAEPKPSRYLTFQDMMLVGFKGGGKTSWLIKFLMWWTTAFCLCLFYDEAQPSDLDRCGPRIQDEVFQFVLLVSV